MELRHCKFDHIWGQANVGGIVFYKTSSSFWSFGIWAVSEQLLFKNRVRYIHILYDFLVQLQMINIQSYEEMSTPKLNCSNPFMICRVLTIVFQDSPATAFRTYALYSVYLNLSRRTTKPTKWHVCPAKTQISLGIRPVCSESSLSAWRSIGSLATYWANSEVSDQTVRMPRLIGDFAGRTDHFVGFVMRLLICTFVSEKTIPMFALKLLVWR